VILVLIATALLAMAVGCISAAPPTQPFVIPVFVPTVLPPAAVGCISSAPPAQPFVILVLIATVLPTAVGCFSSAPPAQPFVVLVLIATVLAMTVGCISTAPAQPFAILIFVPTVLLAMAVGWFSPAPPAQPSLGVIYSVVTTLPAAATPSTSAESDPASVSALADVYWIMTEHTRTTAWLAAVLAVYQIGVIALLNLSLILASPVSMHHIPTTLG